MCKDAENKIQDPENIIIWQMWSLSSSGHKPTDENIQNPKNLKQNNYLVNWKSR